MEILGVGVVCFMQGTVVRESAARAARVVWGQSLPFLGPINKIYLILSYFNNFMSVTFLNL